MIHHIHHKNIRTKDHDEPQNTTFDYAYKFWSKYYASNFILFILQRIYGEEYY